MGKGLASKIRKPAAKPPPAPRPAPAPAPSPGPGVGAALPAPVSTQIGGSLGVDVSGVRVHTDTSAGDAAGMLSSRAFAYGSNVYLGSGERPTDVGLMAHEVAHAVQQGGAPRLQLFTPDGGDRHEQEAQAASRAVLSRSRFGIRERTRPRTQRWGLGSILDWIADKANIIPGFRMFTIVLGVNPINMSAVDRSAANILRAIVEFLPGGGLIVMALDNYGVFDKAGAYVENQMKTLGISGAMIKNALMQFLDSLGLSDILHPGRVWDRAKRIFTDPITRIITFARNLVKAIVQFVLDAILKPLAALAANTRGYDLLKAVLGKDPITGEPYPRTAETLIGGFMKLIGQEEVWENLKKANAVSRAWSWFQGVLSGLLGFVRQIPTVFINTLKSLEISDLIIPPKAFVKVVKSFGSFVGQFVSWGLSQVLSLLQIIFEVLAPGAMPYIRKAAGAFRTIVRNPVGFIGNLVRAGIQGFRQFAGRFLQHLQRSLIQWLTGTLAGAGIYIPAGFTIKEIVKFVLSVLGLTWANIRSKLVRVIPEPVVAGLERGFDIVVTLVRDGPAAAWEKIKEAIGDLKSIVIDGIMSFVKTRIVEAAITKLVTSLNPAGAFIQAVIAIYNTVMFFIERLKQIAQVAMSFIDSIAAIASGAIGAAANKVEQTMGGLLTLVISFLARLVGLGKVSDAVKDIVNKIRAPIDRALDKVVEWIVATARRLGRFVAGAVRGRDTRTPEQKQADLDRAARELRPRIEPMVKKGVPRPLLAARLAIWKRQYGLTSLTVDPNGIVATINPTVKMYDIVEQNIGAELEKILAAAETRFIANQASARPSTAASNERVARAQQAIAGGAAAPDRLNQLETVRVLRSIQAGTTATQLTQTGRQEYPRQTIIDPATQGYTVRVSDRGPQTPGQAPQVRTLQDAFVPEAGRYMYSRDETAALNQPQFKGDGPQRPLPVNVAMRFGYAGAEMEGLRNVEAARSVGNLAASRLTGALVAGGAITPESAMVGRVAGMATGYSAAAGSAGDPSRGSAQQIASATTVRRGSYTVIFETLRQALNAPDNKLITQSGGAALQRLSAAFQTWLNVALNEQGQALSTDEARRASRTLQARLIVWLRQQREQG